MHEFTSGKSWLKKSRKDFFSILLKDREKASINKGTARHSFRLTFYTR